MQNGVIDILLVEDDQTEQKNFERFVTKEKLDYQFKIASTLKAAITKLELFKFDLVLADINLSDGTAFDLYKHIPTFTPVIFITGIDNKETILDALKLGVSDYILKKSDGEHLKSLPACIDNLLKKQKSLRQYITSQIVLHKDTVQAAHLLPNIVLEALTFKTHIGVAITDANASILRVNKGFCEITGYSSSEVIGKNMSILKSGKQDKFFYQQFWKHLLENGDFQGALWNRGKDHKLYRQWATITAVPDENDGGAIKYIAILSNITEQYQLEQEMHQLAFYDALTSLANRRLLLNRIKQELAMTKRREVFGSLIYLDIDKFKSLNDTYGHHAGDKLLIQVAQRIKSVLREEDTASRLGGDEFVILIHATKSNISKAANDALFIANKIKDELNKPFYLDDGEHFITPSIGYTLFPNNGSIAEEILQRADKAMYCSKNKGGNSISIFNADSENQDNRLVFRVMLIEDRISDTFLTVDTLKKFCVDYGLILDIKTFSSGQSGLDCLNAIDKADLPALILLDLELPDMDGYEVLKQIKSKSDTNKISVVVFTATSEYTVIDKCLQLQATDFIQKPLTKETFKQVLRNCGMGALLMKTGK